MAEGGCWDNGSHARLNVRIRVFKRGEVTGARSLIDHDGLL